MFMPSVSLPSSVAPSDAPCFGGSARPAPDVQALRGADDLRYPWPSVRPERAAYLEAQARAWAVGHGLFTSDALRRFDAVGVGLLTALTYPQATLDRQVLLSQFFGWVFLQDDTFDEAETAPSLRRLERHLSTCIRVLRTGALPAQASPRLVALKDVRDRLAISSDQAWFDRFCQSMVTYFRDGVLAEGRLREDGLVPSGRAYLGVRLYSVCLLPPLDLADWACGAVTPAAVATSPALLRVRTLAALVVALANDVFSFKKEQRQGDKNNLVLIRMHEGLSEAEALDQVVGAHDALVARFERESESVVDTGAPASLAFDFQVEACRRWMVGAVDWQRRSRRYG